jgi:ELWxxDGT repeat protein
MYFAATTPETGEELFVLEGGTVSLAKDITPGPTGAPISGTTIFQGQVYFVRSGGLWRYDGAKAVKISANGASDIISGAWQTSVLTNFNGKLYFFAKGPDPDKPAISQTFLRAYDGAFVTTVKQLTIVKSNPPIIGNFDMGVYNGSLYFGAIYHAPDGSNQAHAFGADGLWRYAGAGAPVEVLQNFSDADEPNQVVEYATPDSQPQGFTVHDGKLYFRQNDNLWRYDGATATNLTDKDSATPHTIGSVSAFDIDDIEQLFFSGYGAFPLNGEPYILNGANAELLVDIHPASPLTTKQNGSLPTRVQQSNQTAYFYADDGAHGRELWAFGLSDLKLIECNFVAGPVWPEWAIWGVDRRSLLVETWVIEPNVAARRTLSQLVDFKKDSMIDLPAYSFSEPRGMPESYGVYSIIKDPDTNQLVEYGLNIVGAPGRRDRDLIYQETQRLEQTLFGVRR